MWLIIFVRERARTHTHIYRSNKENLYLSSLSHIFTCPFTAEFPIILNILVMGLHVKFVQYFSLHKNFPYNIKELIRLLKPAKMIVLREELYILKEQSKIQLQSVKLRNKWPTVLSTLYLSTHLILRTHSL